MSDNSAALLSNNLIYAAMLFYTLAFFAHAIEVAWSVKTPAKSVKKTKLDFSRTERIGRLASAFMVIGFLLLLPGVVFREFLLIESPGEICMSSQLLEH